MSVPQTPPAPRPPRDPSGRTGRLAATALLLLAAGFALLSALLPRTLVLEILGQGGAVEKLELGGYAVAAILILRAPFPDRGTTGWTLAALGLLAFLEVNPGNRLEPWIEHPLAHPGDPARLNWPGLAALAAGTAVIFGGLLARTRRPVLAALLRGDAAAWLAAVGVLSLVLAFVLDRYHATHFDWNHGYRLTQGIAFASHVAEEGLEFMAPVLFGAAAGLRGHRGRGGRGA